MKAFRLLAFLFLPLALSLLLAFRSEAHPGATATVMEGEQVAASAAAVNEAALQSFTPFAAQDEPPGPTSSEGSSGIAGTNWFPIGPGPIQDFFPGGVTGRASALAVNPFNPDDVWLGTAAGGVWHSLDGGQNWQPLSDYEDALAIGALALDNCSVEGCDTIYAGTGENAIRRDTYYGRGLLIGGVSGGEFPTFSWTLRTGTPYNFAGGAINNIVLDPSTSGSSKRLYITLSSGVTASATEATVTAPEPSPGGYGVYQSDDVGLNWTKLTIPGSDGAKPTDLVMDPDDSNVLYAGFLGRGIFRGLRDPSSSAISWCPLNDGIPKPSGCPATSGLPDPAATTFDFVQIAIFAADSSILYATLGHCPDRLIQNCVPSLYKSTDGGLNWEQKMAGNSSDGSSLGTARVYSRYTHALAVHPTSSQTIFLGGIKLWKSTNSGETFLMSDANPAPGPSFFPPTVHYDHRTVVIHPDSPNRVYDTSDGGFAFSTNGGTSWTHGNDDLQITGFQSIASSPLIGSVIGASQDNSAQLWSGSRIWDSLPCCGDGGFTVMDRGDVMTMYAGSNYGSVQRSTNAGATWSSFMTGIPATDPRLFYAPFIQDTSSPYPLYYGTNRLFKRNTDAASWTAVSPVLSSGPQPEIVTGSSDSDHFASGGENVITAIAVAPSNSNRIFIGYYSGEIFVTSAPCAMASCWTDVSSGLPDGPVTRIAVHPMQPNTAYATFSGFGSYAHVWKTLNGGSYWFPVNNGLPEGVPANTISIEPSAPANVWVGLDSAPGGTSLYKSTNSGGIWEPFGNGLPNAPVYEISIDEEHGRVYAATHGRGAFVLGRPFLSNFEGWVDGGIWDVPVYGQNFLPNQSCTMRIYQSTGDLCAQGSVDVMGGTIETDADGVLVTSEGGYYSGKPVAWACFNGECINSTPIAQCNDDEDGDGVDDPLTTVVVSCGGELAVDNVLGCPAIANPPSSLLGLGLLGLGSQPETVESGLFHLTAAVQTPETAQNLCSVFVPFQTDETEEVVLERARDLVNASSACVAQTVSAVVEGGDEGGESEDEFPRRPGLRLQAPGVSGGELVTSLQVAPGDAGQSCFSVNDLGTPLLHQLRIMRLTLDTLPRGAAGGSVTISEISGQGTCEITIPTRPGQSAQAVSLNIEEAFQAAGIPGPHPDCPAERNPRDIKLHGDSLISVFASDLQICIDDPGIGFTIAPEELPLQLEHFYLPLMSKAAAPAPR